MNELGKLEAEVHTLTKIISIALARKLNKEVYEIYVDDDGDFYYKLENGMEEHINAREVVDLLFDK
uniref:Uncharacterized protein n=1 Tax=viral metagenome TaxID=1070528 RepID=A0A6M3X759_9ZZZZ